MMLMIMMIMMIMMMILWRRRLAFGGLRLAAVDGFVDASRFGSGAGVGGGLRCVGWRGAAAGGSVVRDAVDRLRLGGLRAAAAAPGERARASVAYSWRSARHRSSWTRSWSWCPSGTRRSALGRAEHRRPGHLSIYASAYLSDARTSLSETIDSV